MIKVIVGLGNPGHQYEKTRHNAGFIFLNQLAANAAVSWSMSSQFQGEVGVCTLGGYALTLLKPQTYMNKSGDSVGKLLRYYKIKPEEMLVAHDELELAEGVIRLKKDGGHAGHNGLRDIIAHLESRDFYRLRIGIGRPQTAGNIADYVLSKPGAGSAEQLENVMRAALDCIELLVNGKVAEFNQLMDKK